MNSSIIPSAAMTRQLPHRRSAEFTHVPPEDPHDEDAAAGAFDGQAAMNPIVAHLAGIVFADLHFYCMALRQRTGWRQALDLRDHLGAESLNRFQRETRI